jgi:3-oxoacyl-[acyl-carrier-protein] synthase-3
VRKFTEVSQTLMERNGVKTGDVDLFVAHQANLRIIDAAKERLGFPEEKVVKNIHLYGNTTAGTIPLALGTALDKERLKKNDLVLLAAVGAGFTVGTALLRWSGVD